MMLDLRGARNWDEIVAMVAAAAREAKPGTWILGSGFHQAKWDRPPQPNVRGFPVHDSLSRVSPRNPVWLTHASGHAGFANAEAMRLAGIGKNTPDPEGGEILRDSHGDPTGLMNERAQDLIEHVLDSYRARRTPAEAEAELRQQIRLAERECLSKGITTFEDAGSPLATVDLFRKMAEHGELGLRMWVMLRAPESELAANLRRYYMIGVGSDHLTVRAIKEYMDGALGSRGAWLLAPYSDLPADAPNPSGINVEEPRYIQKTAELAIDNGFQLCTHAIGDRANREVLNLYEAVFREHPDKKNLRWRIEHAQHLDPADIPRFGELGVIAAMQGIHCTSDGPFVIARLGRQRAEAGAYVWQKLMKSGAVVGNGTDTPVEDVDPIQCYYASVSRRLKDGTVFFPDQRMSRMEALRSYTINNAYAAFEEGIKGSLKVGKLADVTVLSGDILTLPENADPIGEGRIHDCGRESDVRTEEPEALVGVAPVAQAVADLFANLVAAFPRCIAPGAPGFPLSIAQFAGLFTRHVPGLPGTLPEPPMCCPEPDPATRGKRMNPRNKPTARDGEHYQCNHAEEQKFHGLIDEGIRICSEDSCRSTE